MKIEKVAVIGAGIMGSGIANAVFKRGFEVRLFDPEKNALAAAVAGIQKQARRGMDPAKIRQAASLSDAVQGADLVIEAIVEDIAAKQKLFSELEICASRHALFASNTSSLPISEIARATKRADRTLGTHFFNPAVIMRLVELITLPGTSTDASASVEEFLKAIGKVPVRVKESPGFVVNRILLPLVNEAFYLLEEHRKKTGLTLIEAANDIDSAVEKENLLLLGPFNLVDLIGIDTSYKVARIIYDGFGQSPRYLPAPLLKQCADQGRFGRKAGRGVYAYGNRLIDPDQNPRLDEDQKPVLRREQPSFRALDLAAAMVNEGFRILEEGIVASYQDVETCIELGARWPRGPFRLARDIGLKTIVAALQDRARTCGDARRYEPSRLLISPSPEIERFLQDSHESYNNPTKG